MKKRLVAIVLALVMIFSMTSISAIAVDVDETQDFLEEVKLKTSALLSTMESHKVDYGLGGVDFSDLYLGAEIPSYEVFSSGTERISNIHYFPIISDDVWVATAVVSYSKYGDMNIEVSAKYADAYNSIVDKSEETGILILFDDTNTYLDVGNKSVVVESCTPILGRVSRDMCADLTVTTETLTAEDDLEVEKIVETRSSGDVVWLGVPSIVQPTNYTCWAASIASILNYYGEAETVASVCSTAGVGQYTFRSTAQSAAVVGDYGYGWGRNGNNHYYYYSLIMESLITEAYFNESPIFAGFGAASGGSVGHAVVIQGYVNLTSSDIRTMSYMDPGDGYFKASTVPTNGAVTITVSGTTRDFLAGFAVYE